MHGRLLVQDCADLAGSVPVGVAGADHCGTMHDRQDVDFAADVLVHDAVGNTVGLAKRWRLELTRGRDVHQRMADGQDLAARLLAAVENPVAVMLAKEFS